MKHFLPFLLFFTIFFFIHSAHAQSFTIEGPEVICAGTSATLKATGCAGPLQWSTGETTVSITVTPTTSTLYSATCTESGSNPKQATHPVGVFPKPTLTASTPDLCADENVTLRTNSTEYTHSNIAWKRDGVPIVSGGGAYIANRAGTYSVEDNVSPGIWVPYPSAPAGGIYRTFSFIDEDNGWAITSGKTLVKTEDGGKNWIKPAYTLNLATNDSLADVEFIDASTGWLCAGGEIFKTSDGGKTWNSQYVDNRASFLYDLFFLDSQRGWAVGVNTNGGLVLRTVDGGNTWRDARLSYFKVGKIQFVSASVGWAVNEGGGLFKTNDGGTTWQLKFENSNYGRLMTCLYFQDANTGWVGGERILAKTSDGGATWTSSGQYSFYEYIGVPYAIKIVDGVGWVLDQVGFFQTSNGGLAWTRSNSNAQGGSYYENITATTFFPSGKVLTTDRTGSSMKYLPKTQSCLSSVTILPMLPAPKITPSTTAALCQGDSITLTASGCAGTLSWSTGATEAAISITPTATTSYTAYCEGDNGCRSTAYQGVAVRPKVKLDTASDAPCHRPVLTATQVWAGMDLRWKKDGQLLDYRGTGPYLPHSAGAYTAEADASGAWQPQAPTRSSTYQEPGYPIDYLKDIQFVNDSTGFIVGSANQFLRTTDGGTNWVASKIPAFGDSFGAYKLHFVDASQGWISGSFNDMEWYGEVLRTTDGGLSWGKFRLGPMGSGVILNDVFFVKTPSGAAGWGVGFLGKIVNSFDGGVTWTPQTSNTTANLKTVFFLDDHTGWAGGDNGTLLTTNYGGFNWTARTIANVPNFQSLQFLDASRGWAVAASTNNGLYHTSDGGITWNQVPVDTSHDTYLKKVQFVNDSIGFVQSEKFIHATTDGGATWKKSYHHLNTGGMSFTDATHGWVVGGSIMGYVPAPDACASAPISVLPEAIAPLSTLASGSWDTHDVWSCGTVPTAQDAVRINSGHAITLPADYSAKAKSIEIQGEVQSGLNAGLQLGQD